MKYQTLGKKVELLLEVEPDMPAMVVSDQNRVRQVLSNLISNAVKFTDKGFVKVHLRCAQQNDGRGLYEVIVTDTGIGIPASKLGTIFDKFSQVDSIYQRKHGGIGLGLSITKELIENMGGQISVQSELGKGSAFTFTLNLLLEKHGVDQLAERHEDNLPLPSFNMRVLVVEDNLINQKIARMMLEDMGCQVDMAGNGVEVFEHLEHLAEYSIIFMDVGLPDISGYDIASKIRCHSALQTLPIVAMTAHVLERDRQQAYLAGMNDIIAKPVSYERIRAVLECYK
jgi:CheY-like chemotaxis protein/anti-sigma regulatory factor (Ser/Thr protein kinase)